MLFVTYKYGLTYQKGVRNRTKWYRYSTKTHPNLQWCDCILRYLVSLAADVGKSCQTLDLGFSSKKTSKTTLVGLRARVFATGMKWSYSIAMFTAWPVRDKLTTGSIALGHWCKSYEWAVTTCRREIHTVKLVRNEATVKRKTQEPFQSWNSNGGLRSEDIIAGRTLPHFWLVSVKSMQFTVL